MADDLKLHIVHLEVGVATKEGVSLMTAPATGCSVGFLLPDGRIARPVLGFELETPDEYGGEPKYDDVSGCEELADLGLVVCDYIRADMVEFRRGEEK